MGLGSRLWIFSRIEYLKFISKNINTCKTFTQIVKHDRYQGCITLKPYKIEVHEKMNEKQVRLRPLKLFIGD